jgi:hypothetical protein
VVPAVTAALVGYKGYGPYSGPRTTDHGLPPGTGFFYNDGFWAKHFTPADFPQDKCSFWVPFMSGFGGITIAMLPNGATYWYFSDNDEFSWYDAVHEAAKLAPVC